MASTSGRMLPWMAAALAGTGALITNTMPVRSQGQPCGPNMAFIPSSALAGAAGGGFCIDRFEGSLRQTTSNGMDRPWSPYLSPERVNVRAVSVRGAVPQGYISQRQAAAACAASGKRLCADNEWQRACRGPRGQTFPYGERRIQGRCNENHRWHPVVQLFRAGAQALWGHVQMNDPQINQLPGTVALTGAHSGCSNEYGVYDMVGNLHEWTANPDGTFRGGYYMDTTINGNGCNYVTTAHDPSYHDYSIGFRCCAATAQ
ncbi:MAG: SUMF1/EgtB/PvdO family nonheme iron enzyme [Polyangiales bacterium]